PAIFELLAAPERYQVVGLVADTVATARHRRDEVEQRAVGVEHAGLNILEVRFAHENLLPTGAGRRRRPAPYTSCGSLATGARPGPRSALLLRGLAYMVMMEQRHDRGVMTMMLKGSLVALITPFADGKVDERAFQAFVEWQIEQGTHGLVVCGTTG